MKKSWRVVAALVLLAAVLSITLSGCSQKDTETVAIAVVNGQEISKDVFEKRYLLMERTYKDLKGENIMTERSEGKSVRDIVRTRLLEDMITETLVEQYLKESNYETDPAQIDKLYETFVSTTLDKDPEKKSFYEATGADSTFLKQTIHTQLIMAEMQKRVHDELLLQKSNLDQEFENYLVQAEFYQWVVKDLKTAELLAPLVKKYKLDETLLKEWSKDSKESDSFGIYKKVRRGELETVLDDKIFKMAPDEVSEPIKASGSYYIVLLKSTKTSKQAIEEGALAEQFQGQKNAMIEKLVKNQYDQLIKGLKEKAVIEKSEELIK